MTKEETELCLLLLLTLLLPLALLVMLESLLATTSTSFADITTQVELSSPERQLLRKEKQGIREHSSAPCHWQPQSVPLGALS